MDEKELNTMKELVKTLEGRKVISATLTSWWEGQFNEKWDDPSVLKLTLDDGRTIRVGASGYEFEFSVEEV